MPNLAVVGIVPAGPVARMPVAAVDIDPAGLVAAAEVAEYKLAVEAVDYPVQMLFHNLGRHIPHMQCHNWYMFAF